MGLKGIREAARRDRRARFTALLHHNTPTLLVDSFYELRRTAAAGVDGVTWMSYEAELHRRVHELHREIHTVVLARLCWRTSTWATVTAYGRTNGADGPHAAR